MDVTAQSQVAATREEKASDRFASSGSKVSLDDLSLRDISVVNSRPHAIMERLRRRAPRDEAEALAQTIDLFEGNQNQETRSLLIDALRLSEPPQFKFEVVREKTFQALSAFKSDPDVVSLCVEELQINPNSSRCCAAARKALEGVNMSDHPQAESLCREILLKHMTALDKEKMPAGLSEAIKILSGSTKDAESPLIKSVQALFDEKERGEEAIRLLAELKTPRAVKMLADIAQRKLRPSLRVLNSNVPGVSEFWDNDVAPSGMILGLLGCGVGALGAMAFPEKLLLGPTASGIIVLASIPMSITLLALAANRIGRRVLQNRFKGDWNGGMAVEAVKALCDLVPHTQAEEALARVPLDTVDKELEKKIAEALGKGSAPSGLRAIEAGLDLEDTELRKAYILALSARAEPKARERLALLKRDSDPATRQLVTRLVQDDERR